MQELTPVASLNCPRSQGLATSLDTIMATIAILGTMDTKGEEHEFLASQIRQRGHKTLVIDTGTLDAPRLQPDIPRAEVAAAAGHDLPALTARKDRGEAVK